MIDFSFKNFPNGMNSEDEIDVAQRKWLKRESRQFNRTPLDVLHEEERASAISAWNANLEFRADSLCDEYLVAFSRHHLIDWTSRVAGSEKTLPWSQSESANL